MNIVTLERGVSLLSAVGKLYGTVLIERVGARTECAIGERLCGLDKVAGT